MASRSLLLLFIAACTTSLGEPRTDGGIFLVDAPIPDTPGLDSGPRDAGAFFDSGRRDTSLPDAGGPDVPTRDASQPDVTAAIDTGPAGCVPGTVVDRRLVAGGEGCSRGNKVQALTCADGTNFVWIDESDFDGSMRACAPGTVDSSGAACGASACLCSAMCEWQATAPTSCPSNRTVFVNFDGVALDDCPGCDQPSANRTFLVGDPYGGSASRWTFAPFGRGRAARDTILNNLSRYFSRFCVDFVDRRPASGAYSMAVVSDTNLLPNHGVCALDCTDSSERVCIVNRISDDTIDTISRYVAHELGHAYGLNHTGNPADIMETISRGSAFTTSAVLEAGCGLAPGQLQNGPAVLQSRMGLRAQDGVGATCHVSGALGRCIDTASTGCAGTLHSGACPGPAGVRCCI